MIIEIPSIKNMGTESPSEILLDNFYIEKIKNKEFIERVTGRTKSIQFLSRDSLMLHRKHLEVCSNNLMIHSLHMAFSDHIPITLNPEILWYIITYEVAQHIKMNPTKYAGIFNGSLTERQVIKVRDNSLIYNYESDWISAINLFRDPLKNKISKDVINLFLPSFSMSTPESETAVLVSFMDAVQKYFSYEVITRCHIPRVNIEGEVEDWKKLVESTAKLSHVFDELKDYFYDLIPVLEKIYKTAARLDFDEVFWRSIYKYNDMSGGGEVTGWITAFFAHKVEMGVLKPRVKYDWEGYKRKHNSEECFKMFPSSMSMVPFKWKYLDMELDMHFVAGVIGIEWNGFISPKLGVGVIELDILNHNSSSLIGADTSKASSMKWFGTLIENLKFWNRKASIEHAKKQLARCTNGHSYCKAKYVNGCPYCDALYSDKP